MILDDRERYRMLKYLYVSPSDFLTVLFGRGVARIGVGAMGAAITLAVGVLVLGVPFDLGRVDWLLLVVVMVARASPRSSRIGLILAAICMQTRQESWSLPGGGRRGAVPRDPGVVFPLAVLPAPVQAIGLADAADVVDRGHAARRSSRTRPGPSAGRAHCSRRSPGHAESGRPRTIVLVLLVDRGRVATLAAVAVFRLSDRRAKERGRYSTGRPDPDRHRREPRWRAARRRPMRIYDGSPRQDFEEVFRSIGAFSTSAGCARSSSSRRRTASSSRAS